MKSPSEIPMFRLSLFCLLFSVACSAQVDPEALADIRADARVNDTGFLNDSSDLSSDVRTRYPLDFQIDSEPQGEHCAIITGTRNGEVEWLSKIWFEDDPTQWYKADSKLHNFIEYRAYDAHGNPIRIEVDWNRDGSISKIEDVVWTNGEMTTYLLDTNNDGDLEFGQRRTFDDVGREIKFEQWGFYRLGELHPATQQEPEFVRTRKYDMRGNETEVVDDGFIDDEFRLYEKADGTPDILMTTTYNADGFPVRFEYQRDGLTQAWEEWTYDLNGRPTLYESDGVVNDDLIRLVLDGNVSQRMTWSYRADGSVEEINIDGLFAPGVYEGADGIPDRIERGFVFDNQGRVVSFEADGAVDKNGVLNIAADGSFHRWHFEYDPIHGSLARRSLDFPIDGQRNFDERFIYDADGGIIQREMDGVLGPFYEITTPADGVFQDVTVQQFNEFGAQIAYTRDLNGDGVPEYALTREFSGPNGEISLLSIDGFPEELEITTDGETRFIGANGTPNYIRTNEWDERGRILRESVRHYRRDVATALTHEEVFEFEYGQCSTLQNY